jgi:hypothetical protein
MDPAARHYVVVDRFFPRAQEMRREIDKRLADVTAPFDPARFAWEHWHVAGQFSQHRTPARAFFAQETIAAFEQRLLAWASSELGLSSLGGPPWLSAIVDGGFQALHRDSPNGHFAFSYGLSKRGARYRGGETLLARPELLDYFRHGGHRDDRAHWPMFDEIPSRFDRLVAFDARTACGRRAAPPSRWTRRDSRMAARERMRRARRDRCAARDEARQRGAREASRRALARRHGGALRRAPRDRAIGRRLARRVDRGHARGDDARRRAAGARGACDPRGDARDPIRRGEERVARDRADRRSRSGRRARAARGVTRVSRRGT